MRYIFFAIFALIAIGALWLFWPAKTAVGSFRDDSHKTNYIAAYDAAMKALPAPSIQHDIETPLGVVRAWEWVVGDDDTAMPVLFIAGRASGAPMWAENLPQIAQARRVIAVDTLGDAGMSIQTVPMGSLEDHNIWLDAVIDTLAPTGIDLVGHSFGGAIAARYSVTHGERVHSLALLEPVFTFAQLPTGKMFWAVVASIPGIPKGMREHALAKLSGGNVEIDPDNPMAQMISHGSEGFSASLPQPRVLSDSDVLGLTMPVYVAIADQDSLAGGAAVAERLGVLGTEFTVETWPNTTHALPIEAGGALNERLLQFWRLSSEE